MTASIDAIMNAAIYKGLFDPDWYSWRHNLKFVSHKDAFDHYLRTGWYSDTSPSENFDGRTYLNVNHDVYEAGMNPLYHYLVNGEAEKRSKYRLRSLWSPKHSISIPNIGTREKIKIAIVLHIFYLDFVDIFYKTLTNIDYEVDLFVTSPDDAVVDKVKSIFSNNKKVKNVFANKVPNRGRNFGPFLVEFGAKLLEYDYMCHLHSKKSLHTGREQSHWATYSFEYLIGDKYIVSNILSIFESNKKLGLYYPTSFWRMPTWVNHWLKNKNEGKNFLNSQFGIKEPDDFFAYPVGGMFWAKIDALKGLLSKKWSYDDFPAEPLPADGTFLHILERSIPFYCAHQGYKQFFYSPAVGTYTEDDSFIFEPYGKESYKKIRNFVNEKSIISFDLFDTLIKRKLYQPDYAKTLVPQRLKFKMSGAEYLKIRNDSESYLREKKRWVGDVDLYEICAEVSKRINLGIDGQALADTEFLCDLDQILPKRIMVELFNEAVEKGKQVLIVSDTYYTEYQIRTIMSKVGICSDCDIYISSTLSARKDSSELWRLIDQKLFNEKNSKFRKNTDFIHIGDNVASDAQNPGDLGFPQFHILAPLDKWRALGLPNITNDISATNPAGLQKYGPLLSQITENPFI